MRGNKSYNNRGGSNRGGRGRGSRGGRGGRGATGRYSEYKNDQSHGYNNVDYVSNNNQGNYQNNQEEYYEEEPSNTRNDEYRDYPKSGQNNSYYKGNSNNYNYHNNNKHQNQMNKKREYNNKQYNANYEQNQAHQMQREKEKQLHKLTQNIDPNYNKDDIRIKGKILDIELRQEDEANKLELDQQRDMINNQIRSTYESHVSNWNSISKQNPRSGLQEQENIFHRIICKNAKFKSNPEIVSNIWQIYSDKKTQDQLQQDFTDLLGFDDFDTISELIQNNDLIFESISNARTIIEETSKMNWKQENLMWFGNMSNNPIQIMESKKNKKRNNMNNWQHVQAENIKIWKWLGFDNLFFAGGGVILEPDEAPINNAEERPFLPPQAKIFDYVGSDHLLNIKDKDQYLTKVKRFNTYCIVEVQPVLKARQPVNLINVNADLPEWSQKCFDFSFFNEIQSKVFEKAFHSDENLLIAAPTGAGKTNIALLTIIHEINKELKSKNLNNLPRNHDFSRVKWDFKILYLVPLKAWANEIVNKFNTTWKYLNIIVNEFSGDVNLSKEQIEATNVFIGIPEKWDLFTRKNDEIFLKLKLMIIDEVHWLNEDRGRVLECIVARTIRKSELNQKFTRLVGLSATLPNYEDVGDFLRVKEGLFSFDASYRATPLTMKFFGINDSMPYDQYKWLENEITYDQVIYYLKMGKQVLIFVHSRNETIKYAKEWLRIAEERGELTYFTNDNLRQNRKYLKSDNKALVELIPYGVGFHNAGVLRKDRNTVEEFFQKKWINVLVSTSTLAWGVNLPAYAVVIKGTSFYDPSVSQMVDIGILDIQQMFGRAGRPQYDSEGIGIIMAPIKKINYFVSWLKNQIDIESTLQKFLPDSLNAEIAIGNICSLQDAMNWLKLTYLAIRITGKNRNQNWDHVKGMIISAFDILNRVKLIRYISKTGQVHSTELGRIACNYYMSYKTISEFNEQLLEDMGDEGFWTLFAKSDEFANMKIYPEEKGELESWAHRFDILSKNKVQTKTLEEIPKPIILLQTYLNGGYEFETSSLFMDSAYIIDNSPRILRAMVEICLHRHITKTTFLCINYMKYIERRVFPSRTPWWQFTSESANSNKKSTKYRHAREVGYLPREICTKWDKIGYTQLEQILNEDKFSLGKWLSISPQNAWDVKAYAQFIPNFNIELEAKPWTRTILNITLTLTPKFSWSKKWNKWAEPFWIIVNNPREIIHSEFFMWTPKQNQERNGMKETVFTFAVPFDIETGEKHARLDMVYTVNIISDRWIGCHFVYPIEWNEIEVPEDQDIQTELLDWFPWPIAALNNKNYENIFKSYRYFNPVQTQIFYSTYNTDSNLLVGAPTGSGKTVVAELGILRLFNTNKEGKIIYIAPLKSWAKERVRDWKEKFGWWNKKVIEVTGDYTPDIETLKAANIWITTPEKWDGISRNWQDREYVRKVALIIIDEIHLLGWERGPIIEVIVSRMRFISSKTKTKVRFIGLSTALANAVDVAEWWGIETKCENKQSPGWYNFKPAVRPCPVTVHIEGFSEKHYCPRMGTMNKPCYNSIINFSDNKPVLIFVSSRRQTRLTALELISWSANHSLSDYSRNSFLRTNQEEINDYWLSVNDENLKHTLAFGIGMHHAGWVEGDRKIVEEWFFAQKIQILIATSTLAWGVNFPAHWVIIKGTEYYHPKLCTYVDMPITDILQMIGRAGRPQYDDEAVACLFVKQDKKNFYKKFWYEPFPLESSLHKMWYDHINAEIASESLTSRELCLEYIKWTYFFKRLVKNPSYYGLTSVTNAKVWNTFLSNWIADVIKEWLDSKCIIIKNDKSIASTDLGRLTSFYYMSYKSAKYYDNNLNATEWKVPEIINLLSNAEEYSELPVRHNEDELNKKFAELLPIKNPSFNYGDSHTKTNLLIQAHLSRVKMPIPDYEIDWKLVLDNCVRILLFMSDIASMKKNWSSTVNIIYWIQTLMQGIWISDSTLLALPYLSARIINDINNRGNVYHLCELVEMVYDNINMWDFFRNKCKVNSYELSDEQIKEISGILRKLPILDINHKLCAVDTKSFEKDYSKPITPEEDCRINISFTKLNDIKNNLVVYSKFSKIKSCRWFIIVGNKKTNEVLAFEKVSFKHKGNKVIDFIAPKEIRNSDVKMYFMSDSYVGLDQVFDLKLEEYNEMIKMKYGNELHEDVKEEGDDWSGEETENVEEEEEEYFENW